jgi:hypothetical protein
MQNVSFGFDSEGINAGQCPATADRKTFSNLPTTMYIVSFSKTSMNFLILIINSCLMPSFICPICFEHEEVPDKIPAFVPNVVFAQNIAECGPVRACPWYLT